MRSRWLVGAALATSLMLAPSSALALAGSQPGARERWQVRHESRRAPLSTSLRSRVEMRSMPASARARLDGRLSTRTPFGGLTAPLLSASPALSGTGAIAGTVRAAADDSPIEGVEACAFGFVEGQFGGCGETDSAGAYEIPGLPAGEYVVEFLTPASKYLTQFYDGAPRESEAQPVTVAEGAVTGHIDAELLEGGSVTGTVTDAEGTPLEGIEVCAESVTSLFEFRCARSEQDGTYEIAGLASGEYVVEFSASSELDYATEFYDETPEGTADRESARPVAVSAPAAAAGIDARMRVGASIEGTVTSAASNAPVGGILVCAFDREALVERCSHTSPQDGSYFVGSLAGGNVEVLFTARTQQGLNFADQYYNGKAKPAEANLVPVVEGETKKGIDAALLAGGQIEGTVTSAVTGLPLEEIEACAFPVDEEVSLRCEVTDAQGHYDIEGLSTEAYVVGFFGPEGEYQPQYYDDAPTEASANELPIEAGTTTAGIDAALKPPVPSALSVPTISGRAVEGQTLTLAHASWSSGPTGYVDEWGRCDGGGQCKTAGHGLGYTLTAADVGDTIVAREAAVNAGGTSRYAYSAPTAIVVMAARESPAPGQGVSGSTSSLPSLSQLGALLRRLLTPAGARIGALLRHGSYSLTFAALAPGQLTISWYQLPKGAHLSAVKSVLVAVGHAGIARAGATKLKIGLTARGRRLLRHAHRLKLTAKGVLSTVGQRPVSAARGFTLTR